MGCRRIWFWRPLRKSVEKLKIWLKWDKMSGTSQEFWSVFHIARSDICSPTIQRRMAVLPWHRFQFLWHYWQRRQYINNAKGMHCCVSVAAVCMRTRQNNTLSCFAVLVNQLQHNCVQVSFNTNKSGAYRRLLQYSRYRNNRCVCVCVCVCAVNMWIIILTVTVTFESE